MEFRQHYSSSRGNLYTLTAADGSRLLIECGVPWRQLIRALDYDLSSVRGCLVTHEHKDHSHSIQKLMTAGVDVYASGGTLEALGIVGERRAHAVAPVTHFMEIAGFKVIAAPTRHDAAEPVLYVIQADNEYMLFATDTSHIRQRWRVWYSIIAIECSYNKDMLRDGVESGRVNETLAKRLLTSHMEESACLAYLRDYCDLSRCRQIHLLHMSGENIDREAARARIQSEVMIETVIV